MVGVVALDLLTAGSEGHRELPDVLTALNCLPRGAQQPHKVQLHRRTTHRHQKLFSKLETARVHQQKLRLTKTTGSGGGGWKEGAEEEEEAPRKWSRLFRARVEHGSRVSTCLMT